MIPPPLPWTPFWPSVQKHEKTCTRWTKCAFGPNYIYKLLLSPNWPKWGVFYEAGRVALGCIALLACTLVLRRTAATESHVP